jgi:hypothetical protein
VCQSSGDDFEGPGERRLHHAKAQCHDVLDRHSVFGPQPCTPAVAPDYSGDDQVITATDFDLAIGLPVWIMRPCDEMLRMQASVHAAPWRSLAGTTTRQRSSRDFFTDPRDCICTSTSPKGVSDI